MSISIGDWRIGKKKEWRLEAISQQQLHFARQQFFLHA
jgi:hypothetical protein